MKTQRTRTAKVASAVVAASTFIMGATAADLRVPANYPTVQAAVDAAADGDRIHIASGVYKEQVQIISKRLTLIGQPGTILRATEQMASILIVNAGHVPIMFVQLSDVTVRGLTFEAERLAGSFADPNDGDLVGLHFFRSSGDVENCAFYGFREDAPGLEGAGSLWFQTFQNDNVTARVVGCTFADSYEGIFLRGSPTRQSIRATIENNTIIGLVQLDTADNYSGILVGQGVGGRIAGNTISGFSYIGENARFPIGFGILASNQKTENPPEFDILQHLEIEGNTLRDNQVHVALIKADGSVVRNNRFQGIALGIIPAGLAVSGTNVTIANNQFEDMPEAIRLLGNDPNYGTLLGIAVNAQVASNRFCSVTNNVTVQSLATATETGTSLCESNGFPSPTLVIAPAVLVSWPGEDVNWTVESATNVLGPWTPSDTTTFTQYGRHNIAVPTDRERRFFRLR